ncbi:PRC-barrel domain-containing protein [Bacillus sp. B1-b2]|uniref:PRC-barrel domain-containing protein n=1 Tax=Bacillus sp. B1-b2 TaxID=2653201 RepID=UPI00126257E3|nr:PRC-barrel domain-containing protein [Bacillus sp. B1-b2]KAB7667347.1 photosystem reaction center subunit H [Bacillus sp. B1-b2]
MKISAQLKGLPIISISNGHQEGNVKSLIINPEKGYVDFLTLDQEDWQESIQAIPFKKVIGVGEYAVTIESANSIIDLTQIPIASELASKKIAIIDTNVITRKGELVGKVTEYQINEETGEIIGLVTKIQDKETVILSEYVITYGKDIIVVTEDANNNYKPTMKDETAASEDKVIDVVETILEEVNIVEDIEVAEDELETIEVNGEEKSLHALKEKQIELLLNKQVRKDIFSNDGELIIMAGTILTLEDIEKAQEAGPSVVIDLSMSVNA